MGQERGRQRYPHEDIWVTLVMFSPLFLIGIVILVLWVMGW